MDAAKTIANAETELIKLDPVLGKLIELQKPIVYEPRTDYFFSLCRAIVGQQVSVAAAAAIFGRLEQATKIDPIAIVELSDDEIKAIGLSRQKTSYIHDLAEHFIDDPKIYNHLDKLSDDEVIEDLTKIKGIGVWTAQMFAMFTLGRLDIFAVDDIGLQRAIKQLYGWTDKPSKDKFTEAADKWRPYRTVACWHLWKSLRNTP